MELIMIKKQHMQPDADKNLVRNKDSYKTMEVISSHLSQLTKSPLSLLDSLGSPEKNCNKVKEKHHD